jgi:hypothetical protein
MKGLRGRTIANCQDAPPAWLVTGHQPLDLAVEEAYGWDYALEMPDDRLLTVLPV